MRLIYRCGRFQDLGYTTILSGGSASDVERAATDRLWQSAQKGAALPGSTGISRDLASEGREVREVLLFDHGRTLTSSQVTKIQAALNGLFDSDLATALKAANGAKSFHAAEAIMGDFLEAALPDFVRMIEAAPVLSVVSLSRKPCSCVGKRMALVGSGFVGLVALVGVTFMVVVDGRSTPLSLDEVPAHETAEAKTAKLVEDEATPAPRVATREESLKIDSGPSAKTRDAIEDFLRVCYGDSQSETVEDIAAIYAEQELRSYTDDGRRDRLQLLDERQRSGLQGLPVTGDKDICISRKELWAFIDNLRREFGNSSSPFTVALQRLERNAGDFVLTKAAQSVAALPPPPELPADCAKDRCLPIIDPADIEARDWIRKIYSGTTASLPGVEVGPVTTAEAFLQAYGGPLRRAEVEFRGEADLMGVMPDRPKWLNLIWNCEMRNSCEVPLLSMQDWLSY